MSPIEFLDKGNETKVGLMGAAILDTSVLPMHGQSKDS